MWIAKFKLIHDCFLSNRCREFGIEMQSYEINEEKNNSGVLTSSLHQLIGDNEKINLFVKDLKKDKCIKELELNENTLYILDNHRNKPVSEFTKKLFCIKPVITDINGWEHWELASHKKGTLSVFLDKLKPICQEFILERFEKSPLQDLYFPKVLPQITDLQKKAFELAVRDGYFESPRKTDLRKLSEKMGCSLSTFQNHLRKAESRILPDILGYLR